MAEPAAAAGDVAMVPATFTWDDVGDFAAIHRLNRVDPQLLEGVKLYRAKGCPKCMNLGYKGRGALMEILLVDHSIRELILKGASAGVIRKQAIENGMLTLRDVGILRVRDGLTSIEEILLVTSGDLPSEFLDDLRIK